MDQALCFLFVTDHLVLQSFLDSLKWPYFMIFMLESALIHTRDAYNLLTVLAVQIEEVLVLRADGLIFEKSTQPVNILPSIYNSFLRKRIKLIKV